MNRETMWMAVLERSQSRRTTLRQAVLALTGLSLARSGAAAQSGPPAPLQAPTVPAATYSLRLQDVPSVIIPTDVSARKGNQKAWPVLQGVSIAQVEVPVGGWRAPHLHTNTAELAVILEGTARAGLQNPQKEWVEVDLAPGDCVYFPLGWPHWLRNTGQTPMQSYFNYGHELPATIELQD